MGVKTYRPYKRRRKHRKNCPCYKCIKERDTQQQVQQLDSIGVNKFMVREDWGDDNG